MGNRWVCLAAATILLSVSGCLFLDGTDSDGGIAVRFRTTEDVYEPVIITGIGVFMNFDIASRLENAGDEDVTLIGCFRPSLPGLQKYIEGDWTTVYAVPELLCLGPPLHLKPGQVFADTLVVSAVLSPDVVPDAKWDTGILVEGVYRLERMVYRATADDNTGYELLPLSDRVSQTFEIRPQYALTN